MKKSNSVAVVTVATISIAIGCSSREEQAAVCVDAANRVVARETCQNNRSGVGYFWYYHAAYASSYPRVGTAVRSGGTFQQAGPSARGGFGGTARARSAAT
jgi:hypothetical protein